MLPKGVLRGNFPRRRGSTQRSAGVGEGFPPNFQFFRLVKVSYARPKQVLARTCFLVAGDVLDQILCVAADADCSL